MLQINLEKKIALVTGSSSLFGEDICLALANAGAEVWIHQFGEEGQAKAICEKIQATGGRAYSISGDLRTPEEVQKLVGFIMKERGQIDILINNAQVQSFTSLKDLEPEEWLSTFEVNLDVPFLCCKEILPIMVQAGEGFIVNISSAAAVTGEMGPHYAASKSALNSMTKGFSREFKKDGIRINGLAPSVIKNDDENELHWETRKAAVTRAVSNMTVILCSIYGDYIDGETILLDGGESLG